MKCSDEMKKHEIKKRDDVLKYNGEDNIDEYAWIRQKENPEVIAYLENENTYTENYMKSTDTLREKLYNEMFSKIKQADDTVPVKKGEFYYYSRVEEGKQYNIYCRKNGSLEAAEEIILDVNKIATGETYMKLGNFNVSPDHSILAFSTDTNGDEKYILRFKNLATGEMLKDEIPETSYSSAWSACGTYIFYTGLDEIERPSKVLIHKLGEETLCDVEVYNEEDKKFFVGISNSRDKKYIYFHSRSQVTAEVSFIESAKPLEKYKTIQPKRYEIDYDVDHRNGYFYMTTNENAPNNKVLKIPVDKIGKDEFEEVVPHNENIRIEYCMLFEDFIALYIRENGLLNFRILDIKDDEEHRVSFPEAVYTVEIGDTPQFNTDIIRMVYSSLVTPKTVYDYNMKTRELITKKVQEIPGGYDSNEYETKREFAISHDGAEIPLSIVYKKGIELNGKNPFFLYGYGSYGINNDVDFSTSLLSLLDRGFVYATAHIRGGGEMGRHWYENGKKLKKKNTFLDFIAASEHVIKRNYTSKENLVIHGRSAGGLLMGAVINMRPELFKAAIPGVPFVDALNTMMDPTLPLTVIEYDEWGNPNEKEIYDYLKSYSPYDNVEAKDYPALLFQGGLNDPRVGYWEPAKMVARIRDKQTNDSIVLLHTKMVEGHSAGAARFDKLKDVCYRYAFFLKVLGMEEK